MGNLLDEVEVETSTKFELFDVLDADMGGELGLDELIGGLMRLRGPISKSEIVAIRLKVQYMTKLLEDVWEKLGCNEEEGEQAYLRKDFSNGCIHDRDLNHESTDREL